MFVFSSCATIVTWFRPGYFTHLYDGKYTGIDTLINVDGYYYSDPDSNLNINRVMFFRDGSIARTKSKEENEIYDKNNKDNNKFTPRWGVYRLERDTIISQFILYFGGAESMGTSLDTYVIKSKSEIEFYSTNKPFYTKNMERVGIPLYFHPYPDRIDSTHWVKDHRWFWKDKKAYKEYKKNK